MTSYSGYKEAISLVIYYLKATLIKIWRGHGKCETAVMTVLLYCNIESLRELA